MRTSGHAKNTDVWGRYYTLPAVSRLLVEAIDVTIPKAVLDLGSGEGALALEASRRWPCAKLATVDIDAPAGPVVSRRLNEMGFSGGHVHLVGDALGLPMPATIAQHLRFAPDVAICNPPFQIPRWEPHFDEIIEAARLSAFVPKASQTDAAVLFLAQNLRSLAAGGQLAIIVPDSLVTAAKYSRLRKCLLEEFDLRQIVHLPQHSFQGTEARAHILVLGNCGPTSTSISRSRVTSLGWESIQVPRDRAALSLLSSEFVPVAGREETLGSVTVDLRRGSIHSADLKRSSSPVLHTTDLTPDLHGRWVHLDDSKPLIGVHHVSAEPGDIIVARVGRNAYEKVVGVRSGSMLISDCLFRLRVRPDQRKLALKLLSSYRGSEWLKNHAHGVAARHINKTDLLRLPLEI